VSLQEDADLIIVGTASGRTQAGPILPFSIQVTRVIKGDPSIVGATVPVDWSYTPPPSKPLQSLPVAIGHGLWFLRSSGRGWQLLPTTQGTVAFSRTFLPMPAGPLPGSYAYRPGAPLSDKFASEVSAAIEAASAMSADWDYLHFGLLDQLHSPVIQVLYQRMASSSSTSERILGLSGLIRGGSAAALTSMLQAVSSFGSYPRETGILLWSIQNEFRTTDAASLVVLGGIAVDASAPAALRTAAAHALAAVHSTTTLPYLAALLDAPNTDLHVEAVGGLASFANGLPVQTSATVASLQHLQLSGPAPYKTPETIANFALGKQAIERKESSYVMFWKTWWMQNRVGLGY